MKLIRSIFVVATILGTTGVSANDDVIRADVPTFGDNQSITASSIMAESDTAAKQLQNDFERGGYWSQDGNMAVDNVTDPKCVLYLNYSEGGNSQQTAVIGGNVYFDCK